MSKKKKSVKELLEEALIPKEDWPYEVPENWVWVRAEFVAQWGSGGTPSRKNNEYYNGDIPWIKTGNLRDGLILEADEYITEIGLKNSSAKLFPKDSVAIAMYGATIGRLGILGIEASTNQACAVGIPYKNTTAKFMFYYFLSKRNQLIQLGKGGAQPNISQAIIKKFPFTLPPLYEQNRIVNKLKKLLNKIDHAKQLIEEAKETFELRRAAILDKAFRGGMGTNKITEKTPNGIKKGQVLQVFPFEVPENWVWVNIKSIINKMSSRDPNKMDSSSFRYIDVEAINNHNQTLNEVKELLVSEAPSRAKRMVNKGDVIISLVRPYLKNIALIEDDDKRLVASTAFYVCSPAESVTSEYLYYLLSCPLVTKYLIDHTRGDNSPSVRSTDFEKMPIPIPPLQEQKRITKIIKRLLSRIENQHVMVESLDEKFVQLKNSILSKAFCGELGTNDLTENSAIELLKDVLKE